MQYEANAGKWRLMKVDEGERSWMKASGHVLEVDTGKAKANEG